PVCNGPTHLYICACVIVFMVRRWDTRWFMEEKAKKTKKFNLICGTADPHHDVVAVAPGQRTSDRAAISPQGRRKPVYRRRSAVSATSAWRWRSGFAVPAVFALAAIVIFVALGSWQLQRKAWKSALIQSPQHRLSAPP